MPDHAQADLPIRLTDYASGGGCGCKLSPALLREVLSAMPEAGPYANLLVGTETGDDAAVWRLDDATAIVATTDFFNPIVDDGHEFGRIAATNALSDVYAMGGRPIMALALLGFPRTKLPISIAAAIVAGGAAACAGAGIPIAGGHSIDCPEPIYGLAAIGLVHPDRVFTNRGARPGDALILTKGLGIGIYGAALRRRALSESQHREMIRSTTQLNSFGATMGAHPGGHAMTDVTGFGLLGHALEMCRGSDLALNLQLGAVPMLEGVRALSGEGFVTGAGGRNWDSYGHEVAGALSDADRALLTDPQTSGGLLIAVAAEHAHALLAAARADGLHQAAIVGRFTAGTGIELEE
jgi:selenide,water dikinase